MRGHTEPLDGSLRALGSASRTKGMASVMPLSTCRVHCWRNAAHEWKRKTASQQRLENE